LDERVTQSSIALDHVELPPPIGNVELKKKVDPNFPNLQWLKKLFEFGVYFLVGIVV